VIRVLVVDDDFRVAQLHASYVERLEGFEVVGTANSAAEALRLADETGPDLVLLDEYLPDGSGSAAIGRFEAAVIMVSAAYAARYWPGRDPLGERVSVTGPAGPWLRVVGVTADMKYTSRTEPATPIILLPFGQHYAAQAKLHLRTSGDPAALAPALRDAVRAVDPALPMSVAAICCGRSDTTVRSESAPMPRIGRAGSTARCCSRCSASTACSPAASRSGPARSASGWRWVPHRRPSPASSSAKARG